MITEVSFFQKVDKTNFESLIEKGLDFFFFFVFKVNRKEAINKISKVFNILKFTFWCNAIYKGRKEKWIIGTFDILLNCEVYLRKYQGVLIVWREKIENN